MNKRALPPSSPDRAATGVRALILLALAVFFPTVLVRNGSDNAYIFFPLAGIALFILSLPFIAATIAPAGLVRIILARFGVSFVRVVGGLCCVTLVIFVIQIIAQHGNRTV